LYWFIAILLVNSLLNERILLKMTIGTTLKRNVFLDIHSIVFRLEKNQISKIKFLNFCEKKFCQVIYNILGRFHRKIYAKRGARLSMNHLDIILLFGRILPFSYNQIGNRYSTISTISIPKRQRLCILVKQLFQIPLSEFFLLCQ
jgi:hypothetical protein